jgi:gliding motility associated protien GldN
MKSHILKAGLFVLLLTSFTAEAQRTGRKRPANGNTQQNTGAQEQSQQNNAKQPSGYNPYGNIPIEVDSSGAADSVVKKSMRSDGAVDKSFINERTPLPYEHLRADDALYTERVWREIDVREKINQVFRYKTEDDNGDQRFINILLNAVKKGDVTAFSPDDDRFTTPMALADVNKAVSGGQNDTVAVKDPNDPSKTVKYKVMASSFNPDDVVKYRIKEDWVFDREASRLFVRIIGIAPLKTIYAPDGKTERGTIPLFWIYYPDLRPTLAKYEVYNPKNMGMGRMTWEELFESRMFSSYIVKSTLDNPLNKNIRNMIDDPILRLVEGENIKDRIFNYEQDLWSY